MDVFDQIATGVRPPPPPSARINEALPSLQEQQLSYALAKQVPDMEQCGFTIETAYGEIVIEPGRNADFIAAIVRTALERKLKDAAFARRDADMAGRHA